MTIRAGLAAAALCAAALACRERGEAPRGAARAPGADPETAGSPAVSPPSGRSAERQPTSPPRRGDRHARGAAGRARPVHEVVGTIVRADPGRVSIRPDDGREITLRIGPGTTIRGPGVGGGAALTPGDEVRASWRGGEGEPATALSVEVRRPERDPWTDRG